MGLRPFLEVLYKGDRTGGGIDNIGSFIYGYIWG